MADDQKESGANWDADFWRLEEAEYARNAVEKMRMDFLASSIDALADRVTDCEQLIAQGKTDYEDAFRTMIKPQVERIVEAKNRVLDKSSLPSVIATFPPKSNRPNPAT